MLPGKLDFALYQGDDFSRELTFTDGEGLAMDLSLFSEIKSQIRAKAEDVNVLAEFTIDDTDAATGKILLSLTHEDTEELPKTAVWDLEMTDGNDIVQTYLAGKITVTPQVTRTEPAP